MQYIKIIAGFGYGQMDACCPLSDADFFKRVHVFEILEIYIRNDVHKML